MEPIDSYEDAAREQRERSAQRMPLERQQATAEMIRDLEASVVPGVVAVGEQAPDFTLTEAGTGESVQLDEVARRGPVVLSFYRGQWCPYCNLEARALESIRGEIRALGGDIYLVGPESEENALKMREKTGATIPLLPDTDAAVATAYRLVFELPQSFQQQYIEIDRDLPTQNQGAGWRLPIPATFVIGPGRRVIARHVDADYTQRMEPGVILDIARSVAAEYTHAH